MKYITSIIALLISSYSISQPVSVDLSSNLLKDDPLLRLQQVEKKEKEIESRISTLMAKRVTRRGKAFRTDLSGLGDIMEKNQKAIENGLYINMLLFESDPIYRIKINNIKNIQGRAIMNGAIEGYPKSKVRLAEYKGSISGTISFPKMDSVIVLLSDGEGVSSAYEVDTRELRYD